jgi:hypothetical protein
MRPLVFLDKDFDPFQKSCPVTRLEFVPGQRPEEHLVAPEVKFVRKKAAKTNSGPLGFISNMLSNKPEQVRFDCFAVKVCIELHLHGTQRALHAEYEHNESTSPW